MKRTSLLYYAQRRYNEKSFLITASSNAASVCCPVRRAITTRCVLIKDRSSSSCTNFESLYYNNDYKVTSTSRIISNNTTTSVKQYSTNNNNNHVVIRKKSINCNQLEQYQKEFFNYHLNLPIQDAQNELNNLVKVWLHCWKQQQQRKKNSTDDNNVYTPYELFTWIEKNLLSYIQPDITIYEMILDGIIADKKSKNRANFAEQVLRNIIFISSNNNNNNIESNNNNNIIIKYSYNKVMKLYCRENLILEGERLLWEYENQYQDIIDSNTYSIIISSWAKQGKPREAEYVLYCLINNNNKNIVQPIKDHFESCLLAWSISSTRPSGQRAELLLLKMQELYEQNNGYATKPCIKSFSRTITAWVNSRHTDALHRVDNILQMMQQVDWSDDEINSISFQNTYMDIYLQVAKMWVWSTSKSKSKSNNNNSNNNQSSSKMESVQKCEDIIRMIDERFGIQNVNPIKLQRIYATLIAAWGCSGCNNDIISTRVQEIFIYMEKLRTEQGVFGSNTNNNHNWHISVYQNILYAYANAGDGRKAEHMLKYMLQKYIDDNNNENNNLTGQDEEKELDLPPAKPDIRCFNSVLLAWSRSSNQKDNVVASKRAEKLFLHMKAIETKGDIGLQLDIVSYNAVLAAMSNNNKNSYVDLATALRGQSYFNELIDNNNTKRRKFHPTIVTYNQCMSLWSNVIPSSNTDEVLINAEKLLNQMKFRSIQPDRVTLKTYIKIVKNSLLPEDEKIRRIKNIQKRIYSKNYLLN